VKTIQATIASVGGGMVVGVGTADPEATTLMLRARRVHLGLERTIVMID
jgi:hypothetical protein